MQPRLLHEPIRLAGASLLRVQSDARLVALARDGHGPAFTTIVDRYRAALVRYCTRLLGPARAEDAVQQALLNAHTAMLNDERDIDLRPWLYRIAHNVSLNTLRGARDTDVLSAERADPASLEDVVAEREHLRATLAAISVLPEPERDALVLREIEGRSHEEIAAALGVTVGGARQHLHRARVAVRTAMTAITPYPLLVRLMDVVSTPGITESGAARASEVAVGTGLGALATKVGVGVLAAGAVAGGALHAGRAHHHHHQAAHHARAASVRSAAHTAPASVAPIVSAAVAVRAGATLPATSGATGGARPATHRHHHATYSTTHRHQGSGDHLGSGSGGSAGSGSGSSGSGSGTGSGGGAHGGSDSADGSGSSGPAVHAGAGSQGSGDHGSGHGTSGSGTSGSGTSGSGGGADSGSGQTSSDDGSGDPAPSTTVAVAPPPPSGDGGLSGSGGGDPSGSGDGSGDDSRGGASGSDGHSGSDDPPPATTPAN